MFGVGKAHDHVVLGVIPLGQTLDEDTAGSTVLPPGGRRLPEQHGRGLGASVVGPETSLRTSKTATKTAEKLENSSKKAPKGLSKA